MYSRKLLLFVDFEQLAVVLVQFPKEYHNQLNERAMENWSYKQWDAKKKM